MLETGVVGSGENEIPETELLYRPQPLHLVAVHQVQEQAVDGYAPVHGVVDHLRPVHAHSPVFQSLSPT